MNLLRRGAIIIAVRRLKREDGNGKMEPSSQESPATPLSINRRGGAPFLQLLDRKSRDRPAARQDQPPGSKRQPAVRAAVTILTAAGSSFHRVVDRLFRPGPAPCPWSRDRPAPAGQGRSLFMYNSSVPIFGAPLYRFSVQTSGRQARHFCRPGRRVFVPVPWPAAGRIVGAPAAARDENKRRAPMDSGPFLDLFLTRTFCMILII